MCLQGNSLKQDEKIAYALRELYENNGYNRFKMSKFEEYDLYVRNKDFLVGDRMITFTDGDGTLLALKPDVTISILKNTQETMEGTRKVYYHENVYRTGKGESMFREIMQTGLECIGNIDDYEEFEVVYLAVSSLEAIGREYMLDISHMGLVTAMMEIAAVDSDDFPYVLSLVREKNRGELAAFCAKKSVNQKVLSMLIDTYGEMGTVIETLSPICTSDKAQTALNELRTLYDLLKVCDKNEHVQMDFSVVNDMGYYNGIVFQGFIKGLSDRVLSGGRYDKLVEKMGKPFGAIGFAITLNELERLRKKKPEYDADVLVLYDEETDMKELVKRRRTIEMEGKTVLVQRKVEGNRVFKESINLCKKEGNA